MNRIVRFIIIILILTGCSTLPENSEPVRDSFEAAQELYLLGLKQYDQGLYESAANNLESALYQFAALDSRTEVVSAAFSMGKSVLALGDSARALNIYSAALSFAEDLGEPEIIRDAANHIANLHLALNDLDSAENWLNYSPVSDGQTAVDAEYYRISGTIKKRRGELDESLVLYDRALAIELQLPEASQVGINYYLKASALSLKGEYGPAEAALLKALEHDKFFELLPGIASDLQALGRVLQKQNRSDEAVLYYARARLAWLNIGREDRAAEMEVLISEMGGSSLIFE